MQKSGEDYLEAVLALSEQHEKVRTTDVALRLGVSKPSVNRAMKVLWGYSPDGKGETESFPGLFQTQNPYQFLPGSIGCGPCYRRAGCLLDRARHLQRDDGETGQLSALGEKRLLIAGVVSFFLISLSILMFLLPAPQTCLYKRKTFFLRISPIHLH